MKRVETTHGKAADPLQLAMRSEHGVTLGAYVFNADEQRLFVRTRLGPQVESCLLLVLFGMAMAIMVGFIVYFEIRDPGGFERFFLEQRLKLDDPADVNRPLKYLAKACCWVAVVVLALFATFFLSAFYRDATHGRRPWIFDRSQGLMTKGNKEVRRLETIRYVLVRKEQGGSRSSYSVRFEPEADRIAVHKAVKGLRDDRFSFDKQKEALRFAEVVGQFLELHVVGPSAQ